MFGDTLVLSIGGTSTTFVKINQDNFAAVYQHKSETALSRISIRHTQTNGRNGNPPRDRHNFEIVRTVFATGEVPEKVSKSYFVVEVSPDDLSIDLPVAMASWASANSGANLLKLLNWES